jgi:transcriptional regulator with XRE-family HTH domain
MEREGIKAKTLTENVGINHNAVTDWKNGKSKPGTDAIVKMAEYFNVSTDYLLGKTDDPTPPRKTDDKEPIELPDGLSFAFLDGFRELDNEDRAELLRMKDRMLELKRMKN